MTAGVRFSLGTFAFDGEAAPYLVIDERAHDLRPLLGEGTTLRGLVEDWDARLPELERLADEERCEFLARYRTGLKDAYPVQPDGRTLFAYPRLFIVAVKAAAA